MYLVYSDKYNYVGGETFSFDQWSNWSAQTSFLDVKQFVLVWENIFQPGKWHSMIVEL